VRVLLCFDVDGTLWSSAGPVTEAMVRAYQQKGAQVVIVSPSAARPPGFEERIAGPNRRDNLLAAARDFPADLRLYVSDNGDLAEAEAAGFTYVDRASFR
jgi:ribonucleotide monophosphatase NagD (HAD superfamily)